jgi:hypothetical protein
MNVFTTCLLFLAVAAFLPHDVTGERSRQQRRNKKKLKSNKSHDDDSDSDDDDRGDYVEFAIKSIIELNNKYCQVEEEADPDSSLDGLCNRIESLLSIGETRYATFLPRYYYANYMGLCGAYPASQLLSANAALPNLFIESIRYHRVLGYGNALRLQGYDNVVINNAYWNHHDLLVAEDADSQTASSSLNLPAYCAYVSTEYEQLKQYARDNFNATDLPGASTFESAAFFSLACSSAASSYIIRSDWEHHRREVVSSLLSDCSKPLVLHTIWHWESLFESLLGGSFQEQAFASFGESFDYLVESFSSPDAFPC